MHFFEDQEYVTILLHIKLKVNYPAINLNEQIYVRYYDIGGNRKRLDLVTTDHTHVIRDIELSPAPTTALTAQPHAFLHGLEIQICNICHQEFTEIT